MKQTITTNEATHALVNDPNGRWSWEGAQAIVEYLEELEEELEEEMEFDIVGIRCQFSEYENLNEFLEAYGFPTQDTDLDEIRDEVPGFFKVLENGAVIVEDF